jgi:hypothetical protein
LEFSAKELGISVEIMKGYAAAAESRGMSNEEGIKALEAFAAKADQIRLGTGEARGELLSWGEGDLLRALMNAKDKNEAVFIALERIEKLRETAPDKARILTELLEGDTRFVGIAAADVKRYAAMVAPPSKEALEAAKQFDEATDDLEGAWGDLKIDLGTAVTPAFITAMENLNKIFSEHPESFQPLIKGFDDAARSFEELNQRDMDAASPLRRRTRLSR